MRKRHRPPLSFSNQRHLDRQVDALLVQDPMHVIDARHGGATHRIDDVTLLETRASRRTVWLDRRHPYGTGNCELVRTGKRAWDVDILPRDTDVGAPDSAVSNQTRRDEPRSVDADGKAKSLRGPDHRRVDANHLPACRDQRPAGIARIE